MQQLHRREGLGWACRDGAGRWFGQAALSGSQSLCVAGFGGLVGGLYFTCARQQRTGSSNAGVRHVQPRSQLRRSLPGRLSVVPGKLLGQPQKHCLVCSAECRHPVSPLIAHKRRHSRDCGTKVDGGGRLLTWGSKTSVGQATAHLRRISSQAHAFMRDHMLLLASGAPPFHPPEFSVTAWRSACNGQHVGDSAGVDANHPATH